MLLPELCVRSNVPFPLAETHHGSVDAEAFMGDITTKLDPPANSFVTLVTVVLELSVTVKVGSLFTWVETARESSSILP